MEKPTTIQIQNALRILTQALPLYTSVTIKGGIDLIDFYNKQKASTYIMRTQDAATEIHKLKP